MVAEGGRATGRRPRPARGGLNLGRFKRGILNIVHDPRVRAKMARGVSQRLRRRVTEGLATGRPRRGEAIEDERYKGFTHAGQQVIAGHNEGMSVRELAKLVGWPKSTVGGFLKRNKAGLEK